MFAITSNPIIRDLAYSYSIPDIRCKDTSLSLLADYFEYVF